MDECKDLVGDATIFSNLEANRGDWQVKVAEQGQDKLAFPSHYGGFRFTRMVFGLKNAPGMCKCPIIVIFTKVIW